jgi:hypothetical protein
MPAMGAVRMKWDARATIGDQIEAIETRAA